MAEAHQLRQHLCPWHQWDSSTLSFLYFKVAVIHCRRSHHHIGITNVVTVMANFNTHTKTTQALNHWRFAQIRTTDVITLVAQHLSDATHTDTTNANKMKDRKSTRLNSSHVRISYAVFCLKK